jgi:TetR/AcrR family transcriptional regulator, lmrAB and yxaGH operons repressor
MPALLISRDEVIDRLLAVFQRSGYDGASLAELSHGTGLGKSRLYHYFPVRKSLNERIPSFLLLPLG